jgi:hypothetical protein
MKRLNPKTGLPFKRGDIREDGYLFWTYRYHKIVTKNGFFTEQWYNPKCYLNNKKQNTVSNKIWQQINKGKRNAINSKRRAAKLQRTPPWLSKTQYKELQTWYYRASLIKIFTDEDWHVDHILPLQGKLISGWHVPWNLQLLPRLENLEKGNSINP